MTEAIRKQAEQWIGEMERTPDEVQAMLAGMKCRVAELKGEHHYRGLGFVPHECRHHDRESFLAGRHLAEREGGAVWDLPPIPRPQALRHRALLITPFKDQGKADFDMAT